MISGNLTIEGGERILPILGAPGGHLLLVSVGSPGDVVLEGPAQNSALNVDNFERLGEITIADSALIAARDASDAGSGTVVIRGERFEVRDNSRVVAGAFMNASEDVTDASIDVRIRSDVVVAHASTIRSTNILGIQGTDIIIQASRLHITQESEICVLTIDGQPGQIILEVGMVLLREGGTISTKNFGETWAEISPSGTLF